MTTFDRVKKVVVDQLDVNPDEVTENASFVDDLGADSLDLVELVMGFEEEFDLEIPDEDAETITTGWASSMRVASSWLANPPNTTECTAPSRAQASIALTASGIIGMYSRTRSPLPTPSPRSTPAKRAVWSSNSR